MKISTKLTLAKIILVTGGTAHAAPLIYEPFLYEPFEESDSTLNGNTPGVGLSGTWSASGNVINSSLSFGDLQPGIGRSVSLTNQSGGVSVGTTLSDAGLLNDGSSLWFSFLVTTGSDIATNGDLGFAFGSESIGPRNNIPIQNGGQALGVTFKNNQIRGSFWAPGLTRSASNSGNSAAPETTYLIAGKITWGDESETIEIYNVSPDLTLGTAVSTYTTPSNLDQSTFDTVSFGSKSANPNHIFDEIRFGATAADVLPTAAGPVVDPVITSITEVSAGVYELTIVGSADTEFALTSSEVLDFDNGSAVTGITQGNIDDPGTITGGGITITTDENGNATFQMTSAADKNFVRIQPPVAVVQ